MINKIRLVGQVLEVGNTFTDKLGLAFGQIVLGVNRLSNQVDKVNVVYKAESLNIKVGDRIEVNGMIKTRNIYSEKTHLSVYVYAQDIIHNNEPEFDINEVELEGYICKPVNFRVTPFNKMICDILVANNTAKRKSYYIPTICFFNVADRAQSLKVGDCIKIKGRFQSRDYQKSNDDGISIKHTTYEVAIGHFDIISDK